MRRRSVAVDAITDTAYVANSGNNTVSVVPLSTSPVNPLQIVESSPSHNLCADAERWLDAFVVGDGFTAASKLCWTEPRCRPTFVSAGNSRRPMFRPRCFTSAHGYVVYVQNSASAVSNVSQLNVIQAGDSREFAGRCSRR